MRTSQEMQAMLIGGGAVAIEFHLPRLLAVLGATQVEIVESDPSRCAELARRFRRDQRIEVVMEPDFGRERDLVIIATPPKFHADYFHAVSTSARGVVIEKPVAIDSPRRRALAWRSRRVDRRCGSIFFVAVSRVFGCCAISGWNNASVPSNRSSFMKGVSTPGRPPHSVRSQKS
ncbi:MAG: Gfo/Idh/MocA family oxidoreductase [Deltaproteobacteria bacterium]|nr:Gfo/Idh/MocA family oxidoreductase [Deltaproteobacteria bacterium]